MRSGMWGLTWLMLAGFISSATAEEKNQDSDLTLNTVFLCEKKVGDRVHQERVQDGAVFQAGNRLKIAFAVNRQAFVYVLHLDSKGVAGVVFPEKPGANAALLGANRQVEIPEGDDWLVMDETPGAGAIYVLASVRPVSSLDDLVVWLENEWAGPDESSLPEGVRGAVKREKGKKKRNKKKRKVRELLKPMVIAGVVRDGAGKAKQAQFRARLSDGRVVKIDWDEHKGEALVERTVTFKQK
jgi:hypothetical protein